MVWPSSHPGLGGQEGGGLPGRLQCAAPWVPGSYPALGLLSATHLLPAPGPGRGGQRASPVGTGSCACEARVLLLHRGWTQEHHPRACTTLSPAGAWLPSGPTANPPDPLRCWGLGANAPVPSTTSWAQAPELCGVSLWGQREPQLAMLKWPLACSEVDRSQM